MLKTDFHIHSNQDPHDTWIQYSPFEHILRAKEKGLNMISFTHHGKLIWDPEWATFGKKHGVTVLPGVELRIRGGDVLVINAKTDDIHSFKALREYKQRHPESLIIAPHPYAPIVHSLHDDLVRYIDLFDAIEISSTTFFDFNATRKAKQVAKKYNKPLFGNTDTHILEQVGDAYTQIDATNWGGLLRQVRSNQTRAYVNNTALQLYCYTLPICILNHTVKGKWLR